MVLLVFGLISLLACFRPPGPLEWDALAYHLADPKLFLIQHRIVSLPTEHHSNFPFTLEMLFTVGLLYNGYALANLFHWLMAALIVAGLVGFCGRVLHPLVGCLASVAFVTTPIVLWEASTAYIDIGLALYSLLSACALVSALQQHDKTPQIRLTSNRWLVLAGTMMGFALGIKYLALVPFGLFGALLMAQRVCLRNVVLYAGVALAIGSPWYVRNLVVLHNPVYPFLYKVFPRSKYWNAPRAAAYQREQDKFGTKPVSKDARSKLLNLMSVPWHVLAQSRDGILYCNPGEYTFTALYGGLYAALILPLAFLRHIPRVIRWLLWLALVQITAWFFLSQVGRYLIQIMPLLAIVGAYTAYRWSYLDGEPGSNRIGVTAWLRLPGLLAIACIFGQAVYVLLSVCTLPLNASGREQMALQQLGQMPSSVSVPTLLAYLGQPGAWEEDLSRRFDAYSLMQWINKNTPKDAGIALYEETRGFYLNRPYLWANQQHSSYIPYETLRDGTDLTRWMQQHGIRYAFFNLNYASQNTQNAPNGAWLPDPDFPTGPNQHEFDALQKWYADNSNSAEVGDRGHQLVGDALRKGLWTPLYGEHGCIVVQIGKEAAGEGGGVNAANSNEQNTNGGSQ